MAKKGQMKISFGMIFSIILIIMFISSAIWGIKAFIGVKDKLLLTDFKEDLQADVNGLWKATSSGNVNREYILPTSVKEICFVDTDSKIDDSDKYFELHLVSNEHNIAFYPADFGVQNSFDLLHFDLENLKENPYCVQNTEGKVRVSLIKEKGETLVKVE